MFLTIRLVILLAFCMAPAAFAQSDDAGLDGFWGSTHLVGFSLDTPQSQFVRSAAQNGFELSEGGVVDLNGWYSPDVPNFSATFLTQLNPDIDLVWGAAIGERGPKYRLGPEATLGLVMRRKLGRNTAVQVDVYGQYGGALRESACVGDYGDLGGLQQVNCRLAASILPPDETLAYLWQQPAQLSYALRATVVWRF